MSGLARGIVDRIRGTALPLRGNDLDTDRIIPGRFLKAITFDRLDEHVFEDDRHQAAEGGGLHPFANPAYQGAAILVVNRNFGCGSSREHAPRALMRWGIRALAGESFSEIFQANALALGLPCFTVAPPDLDRVMALVERTPATAFEVSVSDQVLTGGGVTVPVHLPANARAAFLAGSWNLTDLLLDRFEDVEAVAARLPYVTAFRRGADD
jgi:3-isopropylmalate/(R)-2-methylmalate dehydratase small subunit